MGIMSLQGRRVVYLNTNKLISPSIFSHKTDQRELLPSLFQQPLCRAYEKVASDQFGDLLNVVKDLYSARILGVPYCCHFSHIHGRLTTHILWHDKEMAGRCSIYQRGCGAVKALRL